jgi:hypothetical protein
MNHQAIFALYPSVVTIDDTAGAFDANGNQVTIDESAVNAWVDPDQYKYDRQQAYASLAEQLDMQYWDRVNGTDTWKQHIDAVKTAHPKPTE